MGKRALVLVDGDFRDGEGVGGSLREEGYSVDTSADSWQAIQKMKHSPYDVAVIDLDLPPVRDVGVTAWDLGRIFRAYNPAISIVFLSGGNSKNQKDVRLREDARLVANGACAL